MKLHNSFLGVILSAIFFIISVGVYAGDLNIKINDALTKKGLKYWYVENHDLPIVSLELTFKKAGYAYDGIDKQGLAFLTSAVIKEGTGKNNATSFAKELENSGIYLVFSVSQEYFHIYIKTLSENLGKALSLLSDCLLNPTIDDESLSRVRDRQIIRINQLQKEPRFIANFELNRILFSGHPYSNNMYGTLDTVKNITREHLLEYVQSNFDKNNLIISVVGDVNSKDLPNLLDKYLSQLPSDVNKSADIKLANYSSEEKNSYTFMNIPQSIVVFGHKGISRNDQNYYAAYLLNHALGGLSLNSILMKELRDKLGLTYSTRTSLDCNEHGNLFTGVLYTDNSSAKKSVSTIKKIIADVRDYGIDEKLFAVAKSEVIRSFIFSLSSNDNVVSLLTNIQLQNLGIGYINKRNDFFQKVTLKDVNQLAKTFLSSKSLVFVEVSKSNEITTLK